MVVKTPTATIEHQKPQYIRYNKRMGIISLLTSRLSKRNAGGGRAQFLQPTTQPLSVLSAYELDDYKANFSDIRPIAEQFSAVVPYAINKDGRRLTTQPIAVQKLFAPNDNMGFYDFADYLISSILSQPRALVAVIWKPGEEHYSWNIKGYIFLPPSARVDLGGRIVYQYTDSTGHMMQLYPDTVMEFYYSMATDTYGCGVSPAQASKKWATIEDYIAAYQAGFFQNGAKPDGMFIITANSQDQFKSAVEKLERVHRRGSRGHFNYQYAYRPTDENGNPMKTASIEWVSFGTTNKDLTLGELIDKTQEKKDSAYGVPAIARGNDATATYNNAEVADRNLARKVDYQLRRTWSRFMHELARVCKDEITWTLSYDYEVPALADAGKVKADTDNVKADAIIKLVNAGAEPAAAARALGLGEEWASLTLAKADAGVNLKLTPNSHDDNQPINLDHPMVDANRRYAGDKLTPRQKLVKTVLAENKRIAKAIQNGTSSNAYELTDDEINAFADQLRTILEPLAIKAQGTMIKAVARQFKLEQPETVPTAIDDPNWWRRLLAVTRTHDQYIGDKIQQLLIQAEADGLTARETSALLNTVVNNEKQADMMARNEIVNSERFGQLQGVQALADANDLNAYKVWHCSEDANTCPFCLKMEGTKVPIRDAFAQLGDVIEADGRDYVIDFQPLDVPDAHANCRCYFTPEFEAK